MRGSVLTQNQNSREKTDPMSAVYRSQERPLSNSETWPVKKYRRKLNGKKPVDKNDVLIVEQADEENQSTEEKSSNSSDDISRRILAGPKKNLMCKNILEQTKELCYQHSAVYKDFDSIFSRIITKIVNWELLCDNDLNLAGQALKVMAVSKQIEDLV